jgi:molybdopterin-guanine dinucleotide biosynthesis protein A
MGRDKALLPFRGGTLAESVAREVTLAAGSATLVGNPTLGIPDLYPGEGPLSGILTALAHTTADWNLIVACDMPLARAPFLAHLLNEAYDRDADVLLPRGPSGQVEPLCAVYHTRTRATIQGRFDAGVRKVTAGIEGLRVSLLEVSQVAQFQNVNTPEDWAAYAGK